MIERYLLRVESGQGIGDVFDIPEGTITVGRSSSSDFRMRDNLVSRQHIRIERTGEQVTVENLSVLGTSVDGEPLTNPLLLRSGQVLSLSADTSLRFEAVTTRSGTRGAAGSFAHPSWPSHAHSSSQGAQSVEDAEAATPVDPAAAEGPAASEPPQPGAIGAATASPADGSTTFAKVRNHLFAAAITAIILLAVRALLPKTAYLRGFLLDRSACQWLTLYAFLFGVICLVTRWGHWLRERRMLAVVVGGQAGSGVGLVWNRCRRVQYYSTRIDPTELRTLAKDLADQDAAVLRAAYTPVHDVIQMLPMIGFFGTVLGLSLGLNATFAGGAKASIDSSFASAIATAFDTTLLALACTIALTVLQRIIHRQDESLFTQLGEHVDLWVEDRLPEVAPQNQLPNTEEGRMLGELRAALDVLCGQVAEKIGEAMLEQGRVASGILQEQMTTFQETLLQEKEAARMAASAIGDTLRLHSEQTAVLFAEGVQKALDAVSKSLATELDASIARRTEALRDNGRSEMESLASGIVEPLREDLRSIQATMAGTTQTVHEAFVGLEASLAKSLAQPRRVSIVELGENG